MNIVLLAAGYGTRIRSIFPNIPKALIEVSGKPILGHLLDNVLRLESITNVISETKKETFVLMELPEVCILANYFLRNCFPSSRIATIKNFENSNSISRKDLIDYDFVILPQTKMSNLGLGSIDCFVNTTSLGEMDNEVQNFYLKEIERIEPKYFYSVNRAKKRTDKYNAQGYYDLNFNKRWQTIIYNFTHTYHIEVLAKFKDYND